MPNTSQTLDKKHLTFNYKVKSHLLNTKHRSKAGLSLIEILVVIAMIGILISIAVPLYDNALKKGRDSRRKKDIAQIQNALQLYYLDYKTYPPGLPGQNFGWAGEIEGGICSFPGNGDVKDALINGGYIQTLPQDPLNPVYHYVYNKVDDTHYNLGSILENTKDKDYNYLYGFMTPCGFQMPRYFVTSPL